MKKHNINMHSLLSSKYAFFELSSFPLRNSASLDPFGAQGVRRMPSDRRSLQRLGPQQLQVHRGAPQLAGVQGPVLSEAAKLRSSEAPKLRRKLRRPRKAGNAADLIVATQPSQGTYSHLTTQPPNHHPSPPNPTRKGTTLPFAFFAESE